VVPVKDDEESVSPLERESSAPTARPARAKRPYFRNREPAGSFELTAARASLA
jgi:hypothetical protein